MSHLVRKAGHRGELSGDVLRSIRLTRYQSSYCSLSFSEYSHLSPLATTLSSSSGSGVLAASASAVKKAFCF